MNDSFLECVVSFTVPEKVRHDLRVSYATYQIVLDNILTVIKDVSAASFLASGSVLTQDCLAP